MPTTGGILIFGAFTNDLIGFQTQLASEYGAHIITDQPPEGVDLQMWIVLGRRRVSVQIMRSASCYGNCCVCKFCAGDACLT